MRLRTALDQTATAVLRRMATLHGLAHDDATTRGELVDRLCERFDDEVFLRDVLAALDEPQQAALRAARASGGEVRGFLIERDHPGASEALIERGLLFRTFAAAGPRRGEVFSVPEEILELLPAPPPDEAPPPAVAAPSERRSTDPAFSLFALASTLERPGAQLEADVRGWSEEPGGWDWQARWTFLRHLAQAGGLFVPHADGRLGVGGGLLRLLDDAEGLAERLSRTYAQDRGWSELAEIGVEHGVDVADPSLVRATVIEAVERLRPGEWLPLAEFADWLRRTSPEFLREQLDTRTRLALESVAWEQLELPLVKQLVLGPLYWLGAITASPDGLLVARRLPGHAGASEPCTWHSATELHAPTRCDLATLLAAERYLVLLERGRPSRYRLVQQHVAAALTSGGSMDDLGKLLARLTQHDLPAEVADRLAQWREKFGMLAIRPAVVLQAQSPLDLDLALADEAVRPFVRDRLGPNAAEVAAADALELAAALRGAGHLPRVDAALRLASEPRRSYAGLIDEQVLEFLLVSLLAFSLARPERLAELEGSAILLERLERQFPRERLTELRISAERLAGELRAAPPPTRKRSPRRRARRS